jgi:hypothetical protein
MMRVSVIDTIRYLGYNSLKEFFPVIDIKPNLECINRLAIGRASVRPKKAS